MERKQRVLYISAFDHPGAGNRVLLNWLNWLDKNGFGVYVACPNRGWLGKKLSALGGAVVLNSDFQIPNMKTALKNLIAILILCMFIVRHRIDIVHCNSDQAYYMACLAAKITGRPIVTHLRFHYTEQYYAWMFAKWRRPQMIIMVSEAFRAEEQGKLERAAPGVPIKVLHNCIDPDDYDPIPTDQNRTSNKIFYPAVVAERKRQHQLYKIDKILRKHGTPSEFVAAGRVNEPDYWRKCLAEAEENPGNRVFFIGHIDNVTDGYHAAFLSISLSIYETFGYSVLESMAMGVPVVGYQVNAVEEVLGSSETLVPQDDVIELSRKIIELRNNQAYWQKLSHDVRQRVVMFFSPSYICPVLFDYYDEVTKAESD